MSIPKLGRFLSAKPTQTPLAGSSHRMIDRMYVSCHLACAPPATSHGDGRLQGWMIPVEAHAGAPDLRDPDAPDAPDEDE
jgi:hypothetical protein